MCVWGGVYACGFTQNHTHTHSKTTHTHTYTHLFLQPGLFLQARLKALLKPKLPALCLDPSVTARPTAIVAVYEALLFLALKTRGLFRYVCKDVRVCVYSCRGG